MNDEMIRQEGEKILEKLLAQKCFNKGMKTKMLTVLFNDVDEFLEELVLNKTVDIIRLGTTTQALQIGLFAVSVVAAAKINGELIKLNYSVGDIPHGVLTPEVAKPLNAAYAKIKAFAKEHAISVRGGRTCESVARLVTTKTSERRLD